MAKVFVYGSLKQGFHNHGVMQAIEGKFEGKAYLPKAQLFNLGPYPGLKLNSGGGVQGELYDVAEPGVQRLDSFEGHPTYYRREGVTVLNSGGEPQDAWVYEYRHSVAADKVLLSGNWEAK